MLDIIKVMAENNTNVVNIEFEYDGIPAVLQCKLMQQWSIWTSGRMTSY
jgi:hypothetical protein